MPHIGIPEMIIIGIIALLVFGPKKLPDLGSGLGKAIRDFKGAMNGTEKPKEEKTDDAGKMGS